MSKIPQQACSIGKRVYFLPEPEEEIIINKGVMKRFTGGDHISSIDGSGSLTINSLLNPTNLYPLYIKESTSTDFKFKLADDE